MTRLPLISYYFPPTGGAGAIRWAYLSEKLADNYDIDVLCPASQSSPIMDNELLALLDNKIKIHTINTVNTPEKLWRRSSKNKRLRATFSDYIFLPDNKFAFRKAGRKALDILYKEGKRYDVVIASSPPFSAAILGAYAKKLFNSKLILDMRDSFLLDPNMPALPALHRRIKQAFFDRTADCADAFVAVNPIVATELSVRSFYRKPVYLVPNGVPELELPVQPDKFTISFAGRIFDDLNYPQNILLAMKKLVESGIDVRFVLIGVAEARFYREIEQLGIANNIEITGAIPHSQVLERLRQSSLNLIYFDNRPMNINQIPSKIWDYLAARVPIIAVVSPLSPCADIINNYKAGNILVDNPEKIVEFIKTITSSKPYYFNKVEGNSWEERALLFSRIVDNI
jgi:glycosyltransferase involved in cell wall biosynthesis